MNIEIEASAAQRSVRRFVANVSPDTYHIRITAAGAGDDQSQKKARNKLERVIAPLPL